MWFGSDIILALSKSTLDELSITEISAVVFKRTPSKVTKNLAVPTAVASKFAVYWVELIFEY